MENPIHASAGRYRKLKDYWQSMAGGRMQKISLHAGFSCPNRDGTIGYGGCHYCSNAAFTPAYCHSGDSIAEQIAAGIAFQRRRYPRAAGFLGYLQAYTNTHGPLEQLVDIYECVLGHPQLHGMVIGTRPDCLPEALLDWLAEAARRKPVYIELGIESFSNAVLAAMNRGHTIEQAEDAVARVAARGLPVGGHFLVGFPGEPWNAFFDQPDRINRLPLHSVKVHQLHVFKDTALARRYRERPQDFHFPAMDAYLRRAAGWLTRLRPELYIDRIVGDAPARFVINPGWGVRLDAVVRRFDQLLEQRDLRQGEAVAEPARSDS
jgi:radical SAM protein (TIGR01212 family)